MNESPWNFHEDTKWSVVVALLIAALFGVAWKGCTENSAYEREHMKARSACFQSQRAALECEKL